MTRDNTIYDVMVIGSGFAGMAAACFASAKGLKVVQTGATGGIDFSTGFIDLMGVHPVSEGRRWKNPWQAIEAMLVDHPKHPYGYLDASEIRESIEAFTGFLSRQGLEYVGYEDRNSCALTPAGTVKRTYRLPQTAWKGTIALEQKAPTLIIDFHGLKGFSAAQLVENRKKSWPGIRAARVSFPGSSGELFPEHMAWALADVSVREKLAAYVIEFASDVEFIGFPAVLGVDPKPIVAHLEELTGKHVFEIPTLPPSIAGPRLRGAFDRGLPSQGVRTLSQKLVTNARIVDGGNFQFDVGSGVARQTIEAKSAILATGRFFGKGLQAGRREITEPVFNLPVVQPEGREAWHRDRFFDAKGHPVNTAGIEVDGHLRPLGESGKVAHDNLYAAGAILAHHDWTRMKCGAGIAIATAYKAVKELAE